MTVNIGPDLEDIGCRLMLASAFAAVLVTAWFLN